ncbi:AEC family transporter [Magnetovibrio sp.]|uniref:AEC family transporter n=1 Tax=Magnetovibrio sp. TaxID=2024836 RepID=UPI002F93BA98
MNDIFFLVLPFFALVVAGYVAALGRIIDAPGVVGLNRFVYFFALPALLFNKMAESDFQRLVNESAFVLAHLVAGLAVFATVWFLAQALFHAERNNRAVMALAGCYGNIGFLGIPLLVSVLGGGAAAPLSLMLLVDVAFFIPFATILMNPMGAGQVRHIIVRGVAKNPLILAIVVGTLFSATGIGLPGELADFTNLLGQAAAPAAMFALGAVLAGRPIADGVGEASFASLAKLALHPLIMWGAMTAFGVSDEWRLVATLGAATPVAAALFVIAQEHNAMPVRASTAVLLSTAVSMITLPLLITWLMH